ncbi:hypothetical protein [Lachnospira multipara]|uniref:hypothetical protein n=1 Tax=Lachnospira multipara TaxID=28051 RepID=UPI0003FFD64D|nr:hypothetical protein [Lachnospira multipara]
MRNKKITGLLLCGALITLAACGKNDAKRDDKVDNSSTNVSVESTASVEDAKTSQSNESETKEKELNSAYKKIVDDTYTFISEFDGSQTISDGQNGIAEIVGNERAYGKSVDDIKSEIGYILVDINSDGVDELIFAEKNDLQENSRILAIYTLKNNKAVLLADGGIRDSYYLLNDNTIFNTGSGGASYTIWGLYEINSSNDALEATDFYFTEYNDAKNDWYWYHNTTGEYDKDASECLSLASDKNSPIQQKNEECFNKAKKLELKYFDCYSK